MPPEPTDAHNLTVIHYRCCSCGGTGIDLDGATCRDCDGSGIENHGA